VTEVHIGSEDFDVNDVNEAIEILVTISAEHYDVLWKQSGPIYIHCSRTEVDVLNTPLQIMCAAAEERTTWEIVVKGCHGELTSPTSSIHEDKLRSRPFSCTRDLVGADWMPSARVVRSNGKRRRTSPEQRHSKKKNTGKSRRTHSLCAT
jgi:hypothetical protein